MKINWNDKACCHSGNCVRTLPDVFAIEDGQFVIRPENGSEQAIAAVIEACPGKALSAAPDSD